MELDNKESLVIHIEGLQATLTKRNARIAELERKLIVPTPLEPAIKKLVDKAFKDGWQACANHLMETTKTAAIELSKVRKDAFTLYLDQSKERGDE